MPETIYFEHLFAPDVEMTAAEEAYMNDFFDILPEVRRELRRIGLDAYNHFLFRPNDKTAHLARMAELNIAMFEHNGGYNLCDVLISENLTLENKGDALRTLAIIAFSLHDDFHSLMLDPYFSMLIYWSHEFPPFDRAGYDVDRLSAWWSQDVSFI